LSLDRMSNRNFDASVVTGRIRDKNVAQQIYGAMRNGRAVGNPQTVNANASVLPEYSEGVETIVEKGLRARYTFDLGGIANYVALDQGGGGGGGSVPTVPDAPIINSITPGNGQLIVNFTAPYDGGSSIENYEYLLNGGATWNTPSIPVTATPLVITGLNNGDLYTVTIRAINSNGAGAESNTASGTPIGPVIRTFTADATWIAPAGVTNVEYVVVGGGGGGGGGHDTGSGGGGGGGMVLIGTLPVTPGNPYIVIVGASGEASTNTYPTIRETSGGDGGVSMFGSITALGGGGGKGSRTQTTASGYKGLAQDLDISAATGGSGGGNNLTSAGGSGGGGGGASADGTNGTPAAGGLGGNGIQSTLSGTNREYGKGGAGARGNSTISGVSGAANTGNGGGGGGALSGARNGGAGGTGVVIIKYAV
jgi:hypothetical protein